METRKKKSLKTTKNIQEQLLFQKRSAEAEILNLVTNAVKFMLKGYIKIEIKGCYLYQKI